MVPCGHGAKALCKDAGVIRLVKAKKNSDPPSAAKRRRDLGDDDSLPVIVPRSDKVLVPTSAARIRRLREHLRVALHTMKDSKCSRVAATAGARGLCGPRGADRLFSMQGLVLQERW